MTTYYILVTGMVQGVGFRPFIKNLAGSLSLNGSVINSSIGVEIKVNTTQELLNIFIDKIRTIAPKSSYIRSIDISELDYIPFDKFTIEESIVKKGITLIPADLAICDDCIRDILDINNRRYLYPFTNCTNCGPRYSIIKDIPYDRENTTMIDFEMCDDCKQEYEDSKSRRFHAEPNACPKCGPKLRLIYGDKVIDDNLKSITAVAKFIDDDNIIAVKGIGGYHLICSATSDIAIAKLRHAKQRKTKPFAIMVKDIEILKKYATVTDDDIKILKSAESPILILDFYDRSALSKLISPTVRKIGVMLAYTPLHLLILDSCKTDFIIATSGNLFDEPIISDNDEAREKLKIFTDIFLEHNRKIYTRSDDSVLTKYNDKYLMIRRSRGFAPKARYIESLHKESIFATGANLKSNITLYKNNYAFTSQYIGDLDNVDTFNYYAEVYNKLTATFNIKPTVAITDLHDTFYSSKFARDLGIELKHIQHHVAHFLSVIAEHNINENAVGLILDGFGLGVDNLAWGGEIFIKEGSFINRIAHLKNYVQVGMDLSAHNPSVMLISYLHSMGLLDDYRELLYSRIGYNHERVNLISAVVDKMINSIMTSSAGRLFEAVGSLILSVGDANEYEGDLAIRLENIADLSVEEYYHFTVEDNQLDFKITFEEIFDDINANIDIAKMSAKFHNGFARYISTLAIDIAKDREIKYIALSGGVFQNTLLLMKVLSYINSSGLIAITNIDLPVNDGCISMGQIYGYINDVTYR